MAVAVRTKMLSTASLLRATGGWWPVWIPRGARRVLCERVEPQRRQTAKRAKEA